MKSDTKKITTVYTRIFNVNMVNKLKQVRRTGVGLPALNLWKEQCLQLCEPLAFLEATLKASIPVFFGLFAHNLEVGGVAKSHKAARISYSIFARLTNLQLFAFEPSEWGVSQLHHPQIKIPESVKPLLKRLYCYCIPGKAFLQYPYT